MSVDASYATAFLVGLLGGVHCVGMCGGIVAALSFGVSAQGEQSQRSLWSYLFAYNTARLTSYALAGGLMGGISWLGGQLVEVHQFQLGLQFVAGLFMVALGLYVAGWWRGVAKLEQAGGVLWRYIEPWGRRFLPVTSLPQAFVLGLVWGWLPCGLVYSVLFWAIASGSPVNGALLLLSFGLGTLPNLLAMGAFATALQKFVKRAWVRHLAGGMIVAFGVLSFVRVFDAGLLGE